MTVASADSALSAVRAQLDGALASGSPVRVQGGGTWMHAGRPTAAANTISVRDLSGVIAYEPGDLVITVGAGTTLAEIAAITAEHGQWLALDPYGSDSGTIGATVATGSSGPLALGAGRVRDLTLGLDMLTGNGADIRVGGRVVKNVAGFDLVRLATGSFGTLGIITAVSLRLHARPAVDETWVVMLDPQDSLAALPSRLGFAGLGFLALELLSPAAACAAMIETRGAWALIARVSGNRQRATAQCAMLERFGMAARHDTNLWATFRRIDAGATAVVRVSHAPASLGSTIEYVQQALATAGIHDALVTASPHSGVVRVSVVGAGDVILHFVRALQASAEGARCVWEQLPASCWGEVGGATLDPISQRIRNAFDPQRLLNRGIFGESATIASGT